CCAQTPQEDCGKESGQAPVTGNCADLATSIRQRHRSFDSREAGSLRFGFRPAVHRCGRDWTVGYQDPALTNAGVLHLADSWLPSGDISAISGKLSLLSDVLRICGRSVRAVRRRQRNEADGETSSPLSPVPIGWVRPGSLNG